MKILTLVFALSCAVVVLADDLPSMPTPKIPESPVVIDYRRARPAGEYHFSKKVFIFGEAALAAAKTADAITTRRLLDSGGYERDPLFGKHPSPAIQAGVNLAIFAGQSVVFYATEHSKNKYIRWLGRVGVVGSVIGHVDDAACNASINPHGRQTCLSF